MIKNSKILDTSAGRGRNVRSKGTEKNLILLMKAITLTRFQLKMLSIN